MGLNIRALYGWYSPDAGTYGSNVDAVSDGAGMLELDHTIGSVMAVDVPLGAPGATLKPVHGALVKDFSQTVKTDEVQGTTRLVYKNQVRDVGLGFDRIYLQLFTVVDTVNSTFKFRLNDDDTNDANDSASSFSYGHGNQYDWLITTDSANWILYVDGVEEIRIAQGRVMGVLGGSALVSLLAQGSDDTGVTSTRCGGYAYVEFDGSSDLPDVASTVFAEGTLNGESATYQDFAAGTPPPGTHPSKDNVNDWESGSADDATSSDHAAAAIGLTSLQSYTTPTYTVVNDYVSVVIQAKIRAEIGNKFSSANLFVYDGSDLTHSTNTIPVTSWRTYRRIFPFAPDGSTTWKNFSSWADLELGQRVITDPDEGEESVPMTTIQGEILDLAVMATAPPSAAEFEIMGIF